MESISNIPSIMLKRIIQESYESLVGEPKVHIKDVLDEFEIFKTCLLEIYRRQQLKQMEAV